jgi:hypothetical protein
MYIESVDLIGRHPKLPSQIRLNNHCLDDDSFLYIAVNGHSGEFLRLFHTKAIDKISVKAKQKAFVGILQKGHSQEMICGLLTDGFVDGRLRVEYHKLTALHWACIHGYIDVVLLLLNYDNVDLCSKDRRGNEPIHYAAQYGHMESYSF